MTEDIIQDFTEIIKKYNAKAYKEYQMKLEKRNLKMT
jgi:hypothetical protein